MEKSIALTTAIGIALVVLTGVAPASATQSRVDASTPTATALLADPGTTLWPLFESVYDGTIYELVTDGGVQTPVRLTFEKWRDVYGFSRPGTTATDFVKYPWSPTSYAVTFWLGGESAWQWTALTFEKWQMSGYPPVRNAGWIKGSYYYKWGMSPEVFVEGADGVNHKLTPREWEASGFRPYADRSNEGFRKLSWASDVLRVTNFALGFADAISYNEWAAEDFPTPQVVDRLPNDLFYQNAGDSTLYYAADGINRPITFAEWTAAGRPAPTVYSGE